PVPRAPLSFPTRRSSDLSVLLHAVATLLVFLLLARLLPRTTAGSYGALAGASVFAVHPVHVEAVANVVGQAELLAAIALLAACEDRKSTRLNSSHVKISY